MVLAMVLLAGGSASRMGGDRNKVFLEIAGRPMIDFALATFGAIPAIDRVVLVVRDGDQAPAQSAVARAGAGKVEAVVVGGDTRTESEAAGLAALAPAVRDGEVDVIGVHDAARPFASAVLVHRLVGAVDPSHGAIPGLPPPTPVFRSSGVRLEWIDQQRLVRAQTPQVFPARALLAAFAQAMEEAAGGFDTAEIVERHSALRVRVVPGDPRNVKVTYQEDLAQATRLARRFQDGDWLE